MKMIRKVIHHLPTDKEWFSKGVELTNEVDKAYNEWLSDIMSGNTTAFSFVASLGDTSTRKVAFTNEVLKNCVVYLEVWEVNE